MLFERMCLLWQGLSIFTLMAQRLSDSSGEDTLTRPETSSWARSVSSTWSEGSGGKSAGGRSCWWTWTSQSPATHTHTKDEWWATKYKSSSCDKSKTNSRQSRKGAVFTRLHIYKVKLIYKHWISDLPFFMPTNHTFSHSHKVFLCCPFEETFFTTYSTSKHSFIFLPSCSVSLLPPPLCLPLFSLPPLSKTLNGMGCAGQGKSN